MSPAIPKTSRTWFLAAVAMFAMCCYPGLTGEMTYMVGDELGWAVPTNNSSYYQTWAANKTFMVGDTLNFTWTATHDVANVTEADYMNCTKVISVIGSPVLINLTTSGPHYYICTVGPHCSLGQKLAITVKASTTISTPPPGSSPSAASSMSIDFFSVHVLPVAYYGVLILVIFV